MSLPPENSPGLETLWRAGLVPIESIGPVPAVDRVVPPPNPAPDDGAGCPPVGAVPGVTVPKFWAGVERLGEVSVWSASEASSTGVFLPLDMFISLCSLGLLQRVFCV